MPRRSREPLKNPSKLTLDQVGSLRKYSRELALYAGFFSNLFSSLDLADLTSEEITMISNHLAEFQEKQGQFLKTFYGEPF